MQDRYSPSRIARLSTEITKAEAQVVYALFDQTPDEIALLESAI